MEQLYSSILLGHLDLRLPLANGQAPERALLLSRLVAMPVQQHLQLQANFSSRRLFTQTNQHLISSPATDILEAFHIEKLGTYR